MSASQPLTGDELAAIKARGKRVASLAPPGRETSTVYILGMEDVPRLVAEVERLRAQVERVGDVHGVCVDAPPDAVALLNDIGRLLTNALDGP